MIPFVCVVIIDSPTFQSTIKFPTVAVPPVLLMTEGVMDCADPTCVAQRVRKVKRREEKVREGKKLRLAVFIFVILFLHNKPLHHLPNSHNIIPICEVGNRNGCLC